MKNLLKGALLVGAAVGIGLEIAKKLNKKEQEVKEETVKEEVEITAENIDELIEKEKRDHEEKMAEIEKRYEKTMKKIRTAINIMEIVLIAQVAGWFNEAASLTMANASDYSDAYKDNFIICFTIVGGLLGKAIFAITEKFSVALVNFKYYLTEKVRGDQDE